MIPLPDASTLFVAIKTWSNPFFQNMLPWAYLIIGFSVGSLLAIFIIETAGGALSKFFGFSSKDQEPWNIQSWYMDEEYNNQGQRLKVKSRTYMHRNPEYEGSYDATPVIK